MDLADRIKTEIENRADNRVVDLHVWYVGANKYAAIVALVTHYPRAVEHYKEMLAAIPELAHTTVEIHKCEGEACIEVSPQDRRA